MNKVEAPQFEPGMIAVLHRTDATWRGLIANTRGPRPSVVNASEFPADRAVRIDAWLDEYQVGQVLCILPAATVICRNCSLPDAAPDQLEQALALQAEAHLLGMAPPHRLGMAVLPNSNGETSRSGIILAWPEAAVFAPPPTERQVQYVPDIAAMAALLNGSRPTEPLIWLDRTDGSVALALTHAGGAVFRGTREDAQSPEQWQRSVGRVIAETGLSVGHTGAFIENLARGGQQMAGSLRSNQSALFVPAQIIADANQRVQGASADAGWWSRFGIALGAVLARSGPLAGLTQMLAAPPIQKPSPIKTFIASMSRPRTAMRLAVACVLLLAFGPLAVHAARWGLLRVRFGSLDDELKTAHDYKQQVSMYKAMESQDTLPMTKLLSDIACNTPEGIDVESLKVDAGEFSVQGTARANGPLSAAQVVAKMQADLHGTTIFRDVVYNWGEGTNLGTIKFTVSGKIANPFHEHRYDTDRDYQLWTLQERQNGDPPRTAVAKKNGDATPSPAKPDAGRPEDEQPEEPRIGESDVVSGSHVADTSGDEDEDEEEGPARTTGSGIRLSGRDLPIGGGANTGDTTLPPSRQIPEPLTPEEIERMSLDEAKHALEKVSGARRHANADDATKARLKKEFDLLLAQINKVKPKKT